MINKLIALIFAIVAVVSAQPKSNLLLISEGLSGPVVSTLDSLSNVEKISTVHLQLPGSNPQFGWFKSELSRRLLAKNYQVSDKLDNSDIIIKIEQMYSAIEYQSKAKIPLKKSKVRRVVKSNLTAQFFNGSEILKLIKQYSNKSEDIILNKEINVVENKAFPFSIGTKKESALIKRLIEPVIVSGSTIAVIYLLYTLRSGS